MQDDMDFDTSIILAVTESLSHAAVRLKAQLAAVASGVPSCPEALEHQVCFFPASPNTLQILRPVVFFYRYFHESNIHHQSG
jgi:altronate dehydratase